MIEINQIAGVSNYTKGLKAVVFDLDNTFYGEKEYIRGGYRAIAKAIPQAKNAERRSWCLFLGEKPTIDEVLPMGGIYTEEIRQGCLGVCHLHRPNIHLYDRVMELLTKLRCHGCELSVITDGRPGGQRAKIRVLGLGKRMDHIIVTDELGGAEHRGPNEAAFIQMADKLNMAFTQMCYVGDDTKKDLSAPLKLGMRAVRFRDQDGLY